MQTYKHTNGKKKDMRHTVGTSDEEWTRDCSKPSECRKNPVGFNPKDPEDVRPWNRARKRFRCHQWGYFRIVGTQECRWPEVDPKHGGEGARGAPNPSQPSKSRNNDGDAEGQEHRCGGLEMGGMRGSAGVICYTAFRMRHLS
jgi:hypothetical protein